MKNRRRNRKVYAEHSYWQSYSDMMAALLLIFILLMRYTDRKQMISIGQVLI